MPEQISENKKRLAEITAGIENGIKDLWQSDRYKQYLQVMSRFHHYSVNNTMLIFLQNPHASHVAGFKKWEKNFDRHVKKGEKGIQIIAPTPFKKKVEEEKLDPETKAPMALYNRGTREATIAALEEMKPHLEADDADLKALTDSTLDKDEYGHYGHSHTFLDGSSGFVMYSPSGAIFRHTDPKYEQKLTWTVIEKRLRELVSAGQYLTGTEMAQYRELEREYAGIPGGVPMPYPKVAFPSPEEVQSSEAAKLPLVSDEYVTEIIRYDVGRGNTWADLFAQFPSVQDESARTDLLRAHFGEVFTGFYAQDHTLIGFHGSENGLELWQGEYLSAYARTMLPWSEVARLVDREIAADIDRTQPEAVPTEETPPPAPAMDPQEAIDNAIREWNGSIESKHAVVRYMDGHAREKGTAAWLRNEYGDDLPAFPVTSDAITKDIPWPKVQRRIAQLIAEDRFYSEAELDRFDDIDPVAIRGELERRQAQGTSPFVEMVTADVERIAASEEQEAPSTPDLSDRPLSRQGDTITVGDGPATHEITATVTDNEWEQIQAAIPEQDAPAFDPLAPAYRIGTRVYIDGRPYEVVQSYCLVTEDILLPVFLFIIFPPSVDITWLLIREKV